MSIPLRKHRFTVEDFHRMAEAGILEEDDRVELIEGEIIEMSPIGSRHAACVKRLNRVLGRALGDRALIAVQDPIQLSDISEPQPDVAVLKPRPDDYAAGHPRSADVLLVVEVADTSLAADRGVKAPLYAVAGIPELWIVDLDGDVLELHRDHTPEGYRSTRRVGRGKTVQPLAFPDLEISIDDVLV